MPANTIPNKPLKRKNIISILFLINSHLWKENIDCIYTHCNATSILIPDKTTIGNKQYPNTDTTAPNVTDVCVAITVNNP